MSTDTEDSKKLTIAMSDRRPLSIVAAAWPRIARGADYSGEHEFQAFDGAWIAVRQHADGRSIVYGYAGDWDGGGRPRRENRRAGYLVGPGEDVVRAIHRVAGVLAGTDHLGEMAHAAARRCIADLPCETLDADDRAARLAKALDDAIQNVAEEAREIVRSAECNGLVDVKGPRRGYLVGEAEIAELRAALKAWSDASTALARGGAS